MAMGLGRRQAATHRPSPTATPVLALFTFNSSGASSTLDNLFVTAEGGAFCGAAVVLKGNPTKYDAGSIQSIQTDNDAGNWSSGVLQQVPGDASAADAGSPNYCDQIIFITNVSNSTITIKGLAVTYVVASVTNSYHYNLYNCAPYEPNCPQLGAGVPGCHLAFRLTPGKAGSSVQQDCPQPLVVTPQQSAPIQFVFTSAPQSELYKASISLILGGGTKITLPNSFDDALVFDSPSQFSCYAVAGDKLVQIPVLHSNCV